MNCVGIDLGTTNSVCCTIKNGKFELIKFRNSELLPSSMLYLEGKITVGDIAKAKSLVYALNYIQSSKTHMGEINKNWNIDDRTFTPTDVAAEILTHIRKAAEKHFGDTSLIKAVITVPAYFISSQIDETKKAAENAGFLVERIVTEPVAASIAYGFENEKNCNLYIVDIGGGTFDISVLKVNFKNYETRVVDGDRRLGGDDFDKVILEMFLKKIRQDIGVDFSSMEKCELSADIFSNVRQRLISEAEKTKIALSSMEEYELEMSNLLNYRGSPYDLVIKLTRQKFIEQSADLINKIKRKITNSLENNGIKPADIDKVILVGGSSNMPVIREFISSFFGKEPYSDMDMGKLVAMGAALLSNDESSTISLKDIISHSLGIETANNGFEKILMKNQGYPAFETKIFTTTSDYQKVVDVNVYEGEDTTDCFENNNFYGGFSLDNIEKARGGEPKIEVTFSFDKNRILFVSARDLKTGASSSKELKIDKLVRLEKPKEIYYDIALLLDNSGSMEIDPMNTAKDACKELAGNLIDLSVNRMALISFESESEIRCGLTHNKNDIVVALKNIKSEGTTNMKSAFSDARQVLSSSENVPLVITVTDGRPDHQDMVGKEAINLKNQGIRLITIGVGSEVDSDFLRNIASSSSDYYFVNQMSELKKAFSDIARGLKVV